MIILEKIGAEAAKNLWVKIRPMTQDVAEPVTAIRQVVGLDFGINRLRFARADHLFPRPRG